LAPDTVETTPANPGLGNYNPHTEMMRDEYRVMFEVEDRHWWYRGMRRNIVALLKHHFDWAKHPDPLALDAGCGTGANLEHLLSGFGGQIPAFRAAGFDLAGEALEYSRKRGLTGKLARGSITAIPFATATFDLAISLDVINNLPDDQPGFNEVARVLKREGLFILNLPAYQFLYSEHDLAIRCQRRYNARMVADRLERAGLKIERQTYLNTLLFPPAALVRLVKARKMAARPELIRDSADSSPVHSDLLPPPGPINRALEGVMGLEAALLARSNLSLPFGLSIMTLARKVEGA
jgi:SAM-dependent methyltransferase